METGVTARKLNRKMNDIIDDNILFRFIILYLLYCKI